MNNAFGHLLGQAPQLLATMRSAKLIAATDVTTLITGETGTGKELLAQAMHSASSRNVLPMISINCGALPDNLIEAELFGYRRGAFTDARQDQPGRFKAAHGSTLFLDEVAELPLAVQAKLLRFIESGEIQPLGQSATEKVDVRVIAATNRDLHELVEQGRFREDLYYRLNVVPLNLPPLKERFDDIALLLGKLTARLAIYHRLDAPRYTTAAIEALQAYAWPGNVRELRNFCERMLVLLPGKLIDITNLPAEITHHNRGQDDALQLPSSGVQLDKLEACMIRQALNRVKGNQSKAARLLGITRSALIYRMKKYAIQ
jgi:transcriptional regulator with PAS, ATPase and Fis domain